MSWESDLTDDIVNALRDNGGLRSIVTRETSIGKGINEDVFSDKARNQFPLVRITWQGTSELDEPGDNYTERYRTMTLEFHCAVVEVNDDKRFDTLSALTEKVANALYDREKNIGALLEDEINITGIETVPDMLMAPFGVAVMTVEFTTWADRTNRTGR
jgi:hypothetical protein